MKCLVANSVLLFAALILGCDAIGGALKYRYNLGIGGIGGIGGTNCIPQECAEDWTFSYVSCGCVKDGDAGNSGLFKLALKSNLLRQNIAGPPALPIFQQPNGQRQIIYIQSPAGGLQPIFIPGFNQPQQPIIISPPSVGPNPPIILPPTSVGPNPPVILPPTSVGPNPPIIVRPPSPPAPNCPVIFRCRQNEVFDEQVCRCVCQLSACSNLLQRVDPNTCQCSCFGQQCVGLQILNHATCQCQCPQQNLCRRCEQLNPVTCACEPIRTCPAGTVLDEGSCQCTCGNGQCNSRQRLNPTTCECQCTSFLFTAQIEVPGSFREPTIVPGPRISVSRPGTRTTTPGTRRTPGGRTRTTRRGRRRRDAKIELEEDMMGPEMNEPVLNREKRRRTRTRPSPRTSRPGTRTSTLEPGPPIITPGGQNPSTFVTQTQEVGVCPGGTFQDNVNCRCN